jgi:hypothetical protein
VNDDGISIVDWLEASEGDYCRDLAQFKIGVLDEILDAQKSHQFFEEMLKFYEDQFDDSSLYDRMRFYLPLMFLEESFYLPFEHFHWKIKYDEDASSFKKRFYDYFTKSEQYLNL